MISILLTAAIGIPLGITKFHDGFSLVSLPPSLSPIFCKFEWNQIFTFDMAIVILIFLFMELFDTLGTLLGVATRAKLVDSNGNVKNIKQALMADAVATTAGAMLGTSTVTAYVESTAGVAEGGKNRAYSFDSGSPFPFVIIYIPNIFSYPCRPQLLRY